MIKIIIAITVYIIIFIILISCLFEGYMETRERNKKNNDRYK